MGLRTFLETEWKDLIVFSPEERKRAVEPYFMTSMMTAEVVERLGYPTRQRLEHWPVADSHYAGRMRRPVIPLRTRRKAIELVLGGMQQRQAARQPGASVDAVNDRVKACREGGMATLRPRNRNAAQNGRPAFAPFVRSGDSDGDDVEALRRGVAELELGNTLTREMAKARGKGLGTDPRCLNIQEKTLPVDRLRIRVGRGVRRLQEPIRIMSPAQHRQSQRMAA